MYFELYYNKFYKNFLCLNIFVSKQIYITLELNLSSQERENFDKSVEAVRDLFNAAKKIDKNLE